MMDMALSNLGWTMDGLRQALLSCNLADRKLTHVDLLKQYKYLQALNLAHNHIRDFPAALALVDLIKADLSHNLLTQLHFHNSRRLQSLNVGFNKLEDLESIGKLVSLRHLNLQHNLLKSAGGLDHCQSLRKLNLSSNALTTLKDLAHLPHLQELDVVSGREGSDPIRFFLAPVSHQPMTTDK